MMKINILYMLAAVIILAACNNDNDTVKADETSTNPSRSGDGPLIRPYLSAIISKHVFDQQQNSCNKRTVPPLQESHFWLSFHALAENFP
jgi:uncharacterized lipoprotein YajG